MRSELGYFERSLISGLNDVAVTLSLFTGKYALLKSDITRRDHVSVVMDPMVHASSIS